MTDDEKRQAAETYMQRPNNTRAEIIILQEKRADLTALHGVSYGQPRVQGSGKADNTAKVAMKSAKIAGEIADYQRRELQEFQEISDVIARLSCPAERMVAELRYLCGLKQGEAVKKFEYTERSYYVYKKAMLLHVYEIMQAVGVDQVAAGQ